MKATNSAGGCWTRARRGLHLLAVAVVLVWGTAAGITGTPTLDVAAAHAQAQGEVPGGALGNVSDADMWRAIRKGVTGSVSIPDAKAGQLVQAHGDNWRAFKNGPLATWGAWGMLAVVVILALFFLLRGRIKIEHGFDPQGRTIERFNSLERATHWLTASSFIVLALTGLNLSYGRYVLKPVIGDSAFGAITYYGKLGHNYIAFAFILGIVLMFLLWVKDNIPNRHDVKWLALGGGMFTKGVHPPAKRFNAGQKFIFWAVVLGGASLSISGIALMWPFEITPWAGTFAFLNVFGLSLPTELSPLAETQLSVLWHSAVALVMIIIIIGHIYIGSIGMQGAFDAVGSGQVDLNWAKEHHQLWVDEEMGKQGRHAVPPGQPAE